MLNLFFTLVPEPFDNLFNCFFNIIETWLNVQAATIGSMSCVKRFRKRFCRNQTKKKIGFVANAMIVNKYGPNTFHASFVY